MKKLTAFILVILYSFAMAGTTIAMHYCMGDKVGATLGYSEQDNCVVCHTKSHKMADPNKCCKSENQFVKVTSDQDLPLLNASLKAPVTFIAYPVYISLTIISENQNLSFVIERSEPPDIPVYTRNCNFRI